MITWALAVVFVVGCGLLDRLRGFDSSIPAAISKLIYGLWVTGFLGYYASAPLWAIATGALLFALGSAPGWGHPIGAALTGKPAVVEPEWWQVTSWLENNVKGALAVRGFMWTLPLVVLAPVSLMFMLPAVAMPVAFTTAPYIAKHITIVKSWAAMEIIRGLLFGTILTLGVLT